MSKIKKFQTLLHSLLNQEKLFQKFYQMNSCLLTNPADSQKKWIMIKKLQAVHNHFPQQWLLYKMYLYSTKNSQFTKLTIISCWRSIISSWRMTVIKSITRWIVIIPESNTIFFRNNYLRPLPTDVQEQVCHCNVFKITAQIGRKWPILCTSPLFKATLQK